MVVQGCDVYIGRQCNMGGWRLPKSKWANPYSIKDSGSAAKAIEKYKEYLLKNSNLMSSIEELRGQVLGCWCKPGPCHGDVLVELLKKSSS